MVERYGYVWVALDEPVADIPRFPEADGAGWRTIDEFFETWEASAPRIIDNSLDIAHTAVVHRATVGDYSRPRVRPYTVETTPTGLRTQVPVDAQGVEVQGADTDHAALRDVVVEIVGPLAFVARIGYATGATHVICTLASRSTTQSARSCSSWRATTTATTPLIATSSRSIAG